MSVLSALLHAYLYAGSVVVAVWAVAVLVGYAYRYVRRLYRAHRANR